MSLPIHSFERSLRHRSFLDALMSKPRLLMIQDLDGVCMGLVRDPKRRTMERAYIDAVKRMQGRFFVLTNGEHQGSCGVNGIVDSALSGHPSCSAQEHGLYLPGLAAGGVQLQDCFGTLSHPGVTDAELAFLQSVPAFLSERLTTVLSAPPFGIDAERVAQILDVIVLDNAVSPTLNIGTLHEQFADNPALYRHAQSVAHELLRELQQRAVEAGLGASFFLHLAPNLGSVDGVERLKPASDSDMGTTDFQFMLRGAIKEAGVLALLNHYYFEMTGEYPLGEDFSARTAPATLDEMLALARAQFPPALMPCIVGVGDTLTSSPMSGDQGVSRGGSDRGFLTLVQRLGEAFGSDNAVLFVDSSGGELNRPGIHPSPKADDREVPIEALDGITDTTDPLKLNLLFPGGYRQYSEFFIQLADHNSP